MKAESPDSPVLLLLTIAKVLDNLPLEDQSDSALPAQQSQNRASASARGRCAPSFLAALSAHLGVDRTLSCQLCKFWQCLPDSV